jgi:hypothetical protein
VLVEWLLENMEEKGFDPNWVKKVVKPAYDQWEAVYLQYVDKTHRTMALTALKREERKKMEHIYSEIVRIVKGNLNTTDAERISVGIAPLARTHHRKIAVTATLPQVTFDTSITMGVGFTVTEKGVESKAKPVGGRLIGFRCQVVEEYPNSLDALGPMEIYSTTTFRKTFPQGMEGKKLAVSFCWISPTGEIGEWTRIVIVIIP